jgi:hypothetical protein
MEYLDDPEEMTRKPRLGEIAASGPASSTQQVPAGSPSRSVRVVTTSQGSPAAWEERRLARLVCGAPYGGSQGFPGNGNHSPPPDGDWGL